MSLIEIISNKLGLDSDYILSISSNTIKNYSYYDIPKKNGKERRVYHPSPSLKALQYWLVNNIFNKCHVSNYSYAYDKGCSIRKNAEVHKNNNYILHMDIQNFFESINEKYIRDILKLNEANLKEYQLEEDDIKLILNICLYKGHLVIGSVSAPRISNCVMYDFDIKLRKNLEKYGHFIYTRYADDLIISSTKYIDRMVVNEVQKCVDEYGFKVNNSKTKFMSHGNRRQVTGLVIDNNRVTIGFQKHKEIKDMIYKKLKYNIGDNKVILGHLFFLKDIEPEYFNKIIIKYSSFGNVIEILKNSDSDLTKMEQLSQDQVASDKQIN